MTASARVLLLLPRQLVMPLRSPSFAPSSRPAARGYLLLLQQQPRRCWATAASSTSTTGSASCEEYPRAPVTAAGASATCPHEGKGEVKGNGEAAARVGGEKAAGAQDDSSGAPSPPAPKEALRATAAGRRSPSSTPKGRSGAPPRQRGRPAKPQGPKPPGDPQQGRGGGGGGIIHAAPRSSTASSDSPSSSSS